MKVSDYIINFLTKQKVQHIFYMIGGAITHLVDSSVNKANLTLITMHHEQAAAFAAEAYARCNNKLGVAMATSGPGATNLITGIGSCFFDSVPCLFITGQVNTYEYKFDAPVRQVGFQETDIVSIVKPITKGARLVKNAKNIRKDLEWAVNLAQTGRPGPVLLDIPMNIQRADINPKLLSPLKIEFPKKISIKSDILREVFDAIKTAQRPVILVGGGVRCADAAKELFELVDATKIPVVVSLMGIDAFPHDHPSYVGMLGAYGNRYANIITANADFLLILGSRLDSRQTGTRPETFARGAKIVHIDIDQQELSRVTVQKNKKIKADIKNFLQHFNEIINKAPIKTSQKWMNYISMCHQKCSDNIFYDICEHKINPNEFIFKLSKYIANNAIITVDVGQHQMWVAQSLVVKSGQRVLISGGMGAMGFALPAAIGAAFLDRKRQIVVIVGDGGFQINLQELQTIIRNKLNIKIVLLNNNSLGMVRQFQEIYFHGRTEGTVTGYSNPDFIKIAEAYGIEAIRLTERKKIAKTLQNFMSKNNSCLLEIILPQSTKVEPKLIVNDPIEDQDPKLPLEELEKMMLVSIISR